MKISELKTIIAGVPDEFEFEVEVEKKVSDEELKTRAYPYPFDSERCKTDRSNYDIGWSDGKMKINVRISEL